jgi:hypothetical protein
VIRCEAKRLANKLAISNLHVGYKFDMTRTTSMCVTMVFDSELKETTSSMISRKFNYINKLISSKLR